MRLSLQSQHHKLSYKVGISNCQLLAQLTEQEVLQMFCLSDLQYCHYHLQDLSSLIVQHQQNCGVDLAAFSHKTQFVFACSNYQHNIDGLPISFGIHASSSLVVSSDIRSLASLINFQNCACCLFS